MWNPIAFWRDWWSDLTLTERLVVMAIPFVVILVLIFISPAESHDRHGRFAQVTPEQQRWLEQIQNKAGIRCCTGDDGFDAEWDTRGDNYRVKIDGAWYMVPDEVIVIEPNRIGTAKVWFYQRGAEKTVVIRCFMPGAML